MNLIGRNTISLLLLLLHIWNVYPAPTPQATTNTPTDTPGDMKYVYISEDEYVRGPYDFTGDPCSSAAIYEGDISLGIMVNPETNTSYILLPSEPPSEGREKRGVTADPNKFWSDAMVPYAFHDTIIDLVRLQIIDSMRHWEEESCIRFRPRTTEYNYIEFFRGAGCCSFIGRLNLGRQYVSIGRYCNYFSSITHEIGHSLGFWHEMNRPDRDEYIDVHLDNVPNYLRHNFNRLPPYFINSRGVTYDYNSVMHYSSKAFSFNGKDTISANEPGIPIGPEFGLSKLDAIQANLMYNCISYPDRPSVLPLDTTPRAEEIFSPACGGVISGLSSVFDFSTLTEDSDECQWLIVAPVGHSVGLLVDMNIAGKFRDCINSFEVIDGDQISGYSHGNYCGNYRDYRFRATNNYMLVKMHVVDRSAGATFTADYKARDIDECVYYTRYCQNGCDNFPSGFSCLCDEGYYVSRNNLTCFDVNECADSNGGCNQKCVNTGGSYRCECNEGYKQASNGDCFTGTAEDQCSTNNGGCRQNCVVSGNTYQCTCDPGYEIYIDGKNCADINECNTNPCSSSLVCDNTVGSYTCSCPSGYTQDQDRCTDTDECTNDICDHTCVNKPGTYSCTCRDDYYLYQHDARSCYKYNCVPGGDGCRCQTVDGVCGCSDGYSIGVGGVFCQDVDECATNDGGCLHGCENTIGSFVCNCPIGSTTSGDNICIDEDECTTGNHICAQECINSNGSYHCACREGYQQLGKFGCEDIDECNTTGAFQCNTDQFCLNSEGSYSCECYHGYTKNSTTFLCDDVNECLGTHSCEQTCINYVGNYSCDCEDGYELYDDYRCRDVDECSTNVTCTEELQYCRNTEGSYSCECYHGYTKNSTTFLCDDVNECLGTHSCEQTCINDVGNYSCDCEDGYELYDDYRCRDVDECSTNVTCAEELQYCRNTEGSYSCDCLSGYQMNTLNNTCEDVNECEERTDSCEQNCVNTVGSYECYCRKGYEYDTIHGCTDVDECTSNALSGCTDNQHCFNFPGSHICYCRSGFITLSNGTCQDVDECKFSKCDHTCINTEGSFSCACDTGFLLYRDFRSCYKQDCLPGEAGCNCVFQNSECTCNEGYKRGNGRIYCQDVDECAVNNGSCSNSCVNTIGGYDCQCPEGLELSWDKKTCIEIVSCADSNGGCEHICLEADPGIQCGCREGYLLAEDGRSCQVRPACFQNGGCEYYCTVVDGRSECSCSSNRVLGSDRKSCHNSFCYYSYDRCDHFCDYSRRKCGCKEGFAPGLTGFDCGDIDECAFPHLSGCSHSCQNTEGSYMCTCPEGFWIDSDGKTCRENSPGCGGSIFSDSNGGTFPVITGPFPMQCVWTIRAPQGQLATFRMWYLNVGRTYTCDDWGLEVWEPSAPNYTLLATRCNGIYEDYFTSRKNELLVKIHSKKNLSLFYSFFYYYTESNVFGTSECRQSISNGRNFSSPNFPAPYNPNSQCSTYITSRSSYIELKFFYFNLEWSSDCSRDYVIVRDTHSNYVYSPPLAKLCGNQVPSPIYSFTGRISLVFYSDSSVQTGGFYATTNE